MTTTSPHSRLAPKLIVTAGFAQLKDVPAQFERVVISQGIPKWLKGDYRRERRLAPTWGIDEAAAANERVAPL